MGVELATRFGDQSGPFSLTELPIAVTGSWVKDGHRFSITEEDLTDIVKNFDNRGNGEVVVDYEHASERPEVARGGPVPAAGWITKLSIKDGDDGKSKMLWGNIDFTDEAKKFVEDKKYKYFSPAIDWGAVEKKTGRSKGATITSGALTNHPFLEELPAIQLSDTGKQIVVPVVPNAKIKVKIDSKKKEDDDDKEKLGEISLDQKRSAINDAVQKEYGGSLDAPKLGKFPWVKEIFEDYAIVECDGKLYKLEYSMDKKGNVELEAPQQVTVEYVEASERTSEVSAMKMTDKEFFSAIIELTEAIDKEKLDERAKKVIAAVTTRDGAKTMSDKELSESVVAILDDMDAYGIEGDRGSQDKLRSEAESRAKKIDTKSDDDETEELRDKGKGGDDDDELQARGDGAAGGKVPKFTIRKMKAGDKVGKMGHHAVVHNGKLAGYIAHGDLMAHAKAVGAEIGHSPGTMKATDEQLEEVIQERVGRPLTLADTVKLVEVGINAGSDQSRSKARKLLMTEALGQDGKFDNRKVRRLFAEGKIERVDYADFEDAVEDVERFINEGRFLPRQRGMLVGLCLSDRETFIKFADSQPKARFTETTGLRSREEEGMTASQEVMRLTEEAMKKNDKLPYGRALSQVLSANPDLKDRYNKEQRKLM